MRNINSVLRGCLSDSQLRILRAVSEVSAINGNESYLVGGAVRDGLLGTPILDLDISVSNADLTFAEAVASKCNTRVSESSQFSTYKIAAYGTEVDIAMTKLFGGFPKEFYASYNLEFPLTEKWEDRVDIWNLYPLLVHANLFGRGYLDQIQVILKKYIV